MSVHAAICRAVNHGAYDGLKYFGRDHGAGGLGIYREAHCKGILTGALIAARFGFSEEQLLDAAGKVEEGGFTFYNTASILTAAAEMAAEE